MISSDRALMALVFMALGVALAISILATPAHATDYYYGSDWVVDSELEFEGDEIIVRGNINIREGGVLTLRNSTLMVDSRRGDGFHLIVEETGNLYAYSSVIKNRYDGNNDERFFFDVSNDTIFKDTVISRLYGWNNDNPGGLRFFGGTHLIEDCTISDSRTWGIYTEAPITMRRTTIRSTSWSRFAISTSGELRDMYWLLENCTFIGNADDPYSYGVYNSDNYAGQYIRNLNVSHCTFEGLSYGVYLDPEWRNGVVEMSYNKFDRNSYGVRASTKSLDIYMHHNLYLVRSGGYGIRLYQGSYGNCTWRHEDIRGSSAGYGTGVYLEGAGTGVHLVRDASIWNTYYGVRSVWGDTDVIDCYINTTNVNFYVASGATLDIYNTVHEVGSGFVDNTGGRITAWQRLNISSVKWSDGTTISQGTVYLLNGTDTRIGSINLSLGPNYLDFKRWETKRSYVWYNVHVYPALLDVDTWFRAAELDYMESRPQAIVFTDDFTPQLTMPGLAAGDKVNVSYLILDGAVVERGRGLAAVEVSLDGVTWHSASVTGEMWDFAFNRVADGIYDVTVRAVDKAGNKGQLVRKGVIVDTEAPPIDLDEEPPLATNQPLLVLNGSTEAGAIIYMGQSMAWPDESGRFSLEFPLSEGTNGLVLRVQDVAGNWNQTVLTVLLDTTPPKLVVTKPDHGLVTGDPIVTVAGTTDLEATVFIDGVELTPYKGGFSTDVSLEDGTHTITIEAFDIAGNSAVLFREVTVDTEDPMLVVDSPSGEGLTTTEGTAFIAGRMDPEIDRVFVNGKAETALPGEFAIQVTLIEGENDFNLVVRDVAGNENRTSLTIIRDTRAPNYRVEEVDVVEGDIVVVGANRFATNEDLVFYVSVDEYALFTIGSAVTEGEGSVTIPHQLSEGVNTIKIEVADRLGNLGSTYTYIIDYDVVAPTVAITYPAPGVTVTQGELTLRGVTDDPSSKVWVNDKPVGIKADGTFEMVVGLEWGANTFDVRNVDAAGNDASTQITITRKEAEDVQDSNVGAMVMALVVGLVIGVAVMYVLGRRDSGDGDGEGPRGPGLPPEETPAGGWEEYPD